MKGHSTKNRQAMNSGQAARQRQIAMARQQQMARQRAMIQQQTQGRGGARADRGGGRLARGRGVAAGRGRGGQRMQGEVRGRPSAMQPQQRGRQAAMSRQGHISHAAAQAASRVISQVREPEPELEAKVPTIAQVTVAQAKNISNLRLLLEDLAKGVIGLAKIVGEHTTGLADITSRMEAIEQELGVEVASVAGVEIEADEMEKILTVSDGYDGDDIEGEFEGDGEHVDGDYDDTVSEFGQHSQEAA